MKAIDLKGVALLRFSSKAKRASLDLKKKQQKTNQMSCLARRTS